MKNVWITGASSGIGRALAVHLAGEGMRVFASARSEDALLGLAAEAGEIVPVPLDVTDGKAVAQAIADMERRHGPLDAAVLNAGTHSPMGLEDFSAATARRLIEVNYMGVVHGMEALLPVMRRRRSGRIAIVSSVAGYRGLPSATAYGPSKAALINLAESLKPECDRAGIILQVINPGFVDTPLTRRNEFPMPDLISAPRAAALIAKGLRGDAFEIAFPKRFVLGLKLMRLLPYGLYFALTARLLPKAP